MCTTKKEILFAYNSHLFDVIGCTLLVMFLEASWLAIFIMPPIRFYFSNGEIGLLFPKA